MAVYDLNLSDLDFSSSLWTPNLLRLSNGEVCRIGVISEKIKFSYVHYHKNIGSYFKCFSERDSKGVITKKGACCNSLGLPTKKYGVMVVVGKNFLAVDFKWNFESLDDVKVWTMGERTIKEVLKIKLMFGDFKKFDLRVIWNNEKYQSLNFNFNIEGVWFKGDNSDKLILAADELAENKLLKYLGKDIDENYFKEAMGYRELVKAPFLDDEDIDFSGLVDKIGVKLKKEEKPKEVVENLERFLDF